ncbi:MAG: caspase family protein [SAR324 cluster bacterium]|nr:caspase family protein [SAR324 cluster bacterium]
MIRKLLTCCLLAIFLSTSVVGNLAWAQSLPAEVVITAKRLNVRDDVGGSKLGAVLRGQQFQLKGTKENWGKIEFEPGRLGWISLQYTQPVVQNRSVLQERAVRPVAAKPETVDLSDKRQALVIGNSDYAYAGMLANPVNDANAIGKTLEQLGFEVTTVTDANQKTMERSIRNFGKQLKQKKGVGLFYFAGHGMQFDGENYLLPTDIDPSTEEDVRYDAVPLGKLLAQLRAADNGMNVVVLDACRNDPFARSFRSSSRGLAQVTAPTGSFISYATAPGSVAADGDGENGLFTAKLLKHMNTPGLKLEDVFKQVRVDVQRESGNR